MNNDQSVSLVLSSGGARGLAHIGVIEALEERGYKIKAVAGCSMGALIGGVYAKGNLTEFKEWICNLDKIDVFGLMDFTISSRGFIKGEKVFNAIKALIGDGNIEDLPIPFVCNAVDINYGKEEIFSSGSLFNAIRASASIPTVIKPANINGNEYVDGGILNPIPLSLIQNSPAGLIIASDVNGPESCMLDKPAMKPEKSIVSLPGWVVDFKEKVGKYFPPEKKEEVKQKSISFLNLMNLSFDMMQDRLSDMLIQAYPVDIVVEISRRQCGTFEFYRAKELIEIGKEVALNAIDTFENNR